MSRLVQPARTITVEHRAIDRSGRARSVPETATVGGDTYLDRIAKYVPAEVMAGYMSLDRLVAPGSGAAAAKTRSAEAAGAAAISAPAVPVTGAELLSANLPMIVFAFALLLTPFYIMQLARRSEPGTPWVTHAVVATLAFLVWAYSMQGGIFTQHQMYDPQVAGVVLVAFSIVSGLFTPAAVAEER